MAVAVRAERSDRWPRQVDVAVLELHGAQVSAQAVGVGAGHLLLALEQARGAKEVGWSTRSPETLSIWSMASSTSGMRLT